MRVLIVDDTPENVYMLEALTQGSWLRVSTAGDGKEALEKNLSKNLQCSSSLISSCRR